jgi:tetratricopeptide (TPR) repeat protein
MPFNDKVLKIQSLLEKKPLILVLVIFLLGTAVYLPTVSYDFVWDDFIVIKSNPQISSPGNWPQLLFADFHISQTSKFYRPTVLYSFALDHAVYKENPWGFHLTNTLLHGLNSALVAFLAWLLFRNPPAAALAGAFFALHPAHPEAVAFVSSRTDLLATFFSLLALIALIKKSEKRPGIGLYLLAPLAFFLALASKETTVVLLIPMFLWLYRQNQKETPGLKGVLLGIGPSALMTIPYFLLRFKALNILFPTQTHWPRVSSPLFLIELFFRYIAFSLFPLQRCSFFSESRPSYPPDFRFWLLLALALFLLGAAIYLIRRQRETAPLLAIFFLPWLPSFYYSLHNEIVMVERYLYLPTLGLALLAGWGFLKVPTNVKKWVGWGVVVLLAAYLGVTLWRTPLWKNETILFEGLKKEYPSSPYVVSNLGLGYVKQNRLLEAYQELTLAVRLEPHKPFYHNDLGWFYLRAGLTAKARASFAEALRIWPDFALAYEGMGRTYLAAGDQKTAEEYFYKARLLDPQIKVFFVR